MALHYFIDSRKRLVSVTAEGGITRADVDAYLEAVIGAGALEYRKPWCCRNGRGKASNLRGFSASC